jgi:hypothetical protein
LREELAKLRVEINEDKSRMIDLTDGKCLELSPRLRQTVKAHFSLNGELSHGSSTTEVHEGV